jgi:hypothetical protein
VPLVGGDAGCPLLGHGNQPIKKGTLGNILRTAEISHEEFNRLL